MCFSVSFFSTFKVVSALAILEGGLADEKTTVECRGDFKVGNRDVVIRITKIAFVDSACEELAKDFAKCVLPCLSLGFILQPLNGHFILASGLHSATYVTSEKRLQKKYK